MLVGESFIENQRFTDITIEVLNDLINATEKFYFMYCIWVVVMDIGS